MKKLPEKIRFDEKIKGDRFTKVFTNQIELGQKLNAPIDFLTPEMTSNTDCYLCGTTPCSCTPELLDKARNSSSQKIDSPSIPSAWEKDTTMNEDDLVDAFSPQPAEWEEEWEKLTDTSKLPERIGGADEWLKEHTNEHLYEDYVYGEPMFDLSHEKVFDFVKAQIKRAESKVNDIRKLTDETIEQIKTQAKAEERARVVKKWKIALKKRNGTAQGHINCVEYFDDFINSLKEE